MKFHVPPSAVPTRSENDELSSMFVRDSGDDAVGSESASLYGRPCVSDPSEGGFVNTLCQSLHDAEREYRSERVASGTTNVIRENPHAASTWEDRNMTKIQGYQNDNPVKYRNAWTVANADVTNDKVSSLGEKITKDSVFKGGFLGECPTGQAWRFEDGLWQCSGDISWTFSYMVPDLDRSGGSATVGVFLDNKIFVPGSDQSLESAWARSPTTSTSLDLKTIRARCFSGTGSYSSESENRRFPDNGWKEVDIPSEGFDQALVGFTGEIRMGTNSKYSCQWEIHGEKSNGETVVFDDEGTPTEIKPNNLKDYGTVNGLKLTHLCPADAPDKQIEDGEEICSDKDIRLSSNPGSETTTHEMEELASATSVQ